jgi:hypothetical protein
MKKNFFLKWEYIKIIFLFFKTRTYWGIHRDYFICFFLTIKINPFHAAAQKFLPVNAIWNFIKINYTIENFKKEIKNTYLNIRMLCYKFDTSLETI